MTIPSTLNAVLNHISPRLATMATTTVLKYPISLLPIPPPTHLLTEKLTPDEATPSVSAFRELLTTKPSALRRSRLLAPQSHFSYVSPFPLPFPYRITPPESEGLYDKAEWVEKWLSAREAVYPAQDPSDPNLFYPHDRDQRRELIGLAETGWRDCLPHLDIGDALAILGTPTLSHYWDDDPATPHSSSQEEIRARQELIDVLGGHCLLIRRGLDSAETGNPSYLAPWSLRYSGHQFGVWAGQLGDGRAISILATPHPSDPDLTYELQLKGAGRTPFSRSADGLAVLRSSIREFLCAEAMHALSIPTTRSLTLIALPTLPVERERLEYGCILTRVAPSFLRIGSFEALSPPGSSFFFFGGGQQRADWDALRILGEWVRDHVLKLEGSNEDAWGRKMVMDVARRNALMVAGWQAYGFMHGVMNTDNISVLGLTIDYGPYAFMDVYDPLHICNHTDETGRYAYASQPNMIVYSLRAFLNSLAPLIGAEEDLGNKAVSAGWASDLSEEQIAKWREKGVTLVQSEMEDLIQEVTAKEYGRLMRKRLALRRVDETDESKVIGPLLTIMQDYKLDYHSTFRKLSLFRPSQLQSNGEALSGQLDASNSVLEKFIGELLASSPEPQSVDFAKATKDWMTWFEVYAQRIDSERDEWPSDVDAEREKAAKSANPRFILRQWVLEEVISSVEKDLDSGKRLLAKIVHMACNPFEPWGAEGIESDACLDPEISEERRFCGMGAKAMLGFQCSCSS